MTSPLWGKYCDGGHYCSAPKECCTLGCCYHTIPDEGMFGIWFLGHWYFWALVTATLVGLLCMCSLCRRNWYTMRCLCTATNDDRSISEPNSVCSFYAPPQYSRCNSFHRAPPPPYAEVTSKPDLYPLVISYNGDTGMKRGGSTSYLMAQYFRNYILRPSGSISATSTIDSLSSTFMCNATNEANTIIPPPYSESVEGFTITENNTGCSPLLRSTTSSPISGDRTITPNISPVDRDRIIKPGRSPPVFVHNKTTSFINQNRTCDPQCCQNKKTKLPTETSVESEVDEHNFSELLNLSVCVPGVPVSGASQYVDLQHSYSITASDVSSLNLGTPDSPPRATSPTVEIRELLDKIQQLPLQHSPTPVKAQGQSQGQGFFLTKANCRSKTLYMPLNQTRTKNWLSRSAPTTPSGANFVPPVFPTYRKNGGLPRGHFSGKTKIDDASALLNEYESSDDGNERKNY